MSATIIPSQVALDELTRRRDQAARMLAAGRCTRAQAESLVALWCGIAAWWGATLPAALWPGSDRPSWIDWAAPGTPVDRLRRDLAAELRRAASAEHARHGDSPRLAGLLALEYPLGLAAALPPLALEPRPAERSAA